MPSDVTREEFKHLATRVAVVEREVEGEKLVTRHILKETRHNSADLASMRTEMRTEMKGMRTDITSIRTDLTKLDRKMDGLIKNLPTIVGDAVRKVMGGRGKR